MPLHYYYYWHGNSQLNNIQVNNSTIKSSQVKSNQVKSSQVNWRWAWIELYLKWVYTMDFSFPDNNPMNFSSPSLSSTSTIFSWCLNDTSAIDSSIDGSFADDQSNSVQPNLNEISYNSDTNITTNQWCNPPANDNLDNESLSQSKNHFSCYFFHLIFLFLFYSFLWFVVPIIIKRLLIWIRILIWIESNFQWFQFHLIILGFIFYLIISFLPIFLFLLTFFFFFF